ncbi:MAG TPA: CoA pyrophosphatase [Verrucomicrobiae bacterium]|nr:CoA pyrophosphatase [Verrucomicrobiae bacterium]
MTQPEIPEIMRRLRTVLAARSREILPPGPVPAAVLLPLLEQGGDFSVLFTKRTETLRHHTGEICFPGGAVHPEDDGPLAAALRETAEEIGVPPEQVEVLGALDDTLSVHGYLVTPYVGIIRPTSYTVNAAEIERLIVVPLSHLTRPEIFRSERWVRQGAEVPVYFYTCGADEVWGLTARVLKQFLDLLAELRGASREVPASSAS